ncbi:hypothetical protein J3Q64DRAFT_1696962 [Phycomyces blakesleeanus]|uniref:F-box domain-containing protein n=2 Tax=Phycomyces blakesleeanus TaxID=4837 RepID=A0A162UD87_PHYB8|nr:hypothetical protein PHYBLDRAFT_181171 [Phycomyces blakesleeanus NRRL 1555(-)]OAD74253.1 hypothetical protein PHYBLDRAFT_181171 [Phycomyces blakesleeanus NRRL 1555(-)]|eukprot:XP_018292293.1 hypothetical protein PHYBLDRAFT_181171 [Phycomyces blakesleeanus NRRL 1555(-)]
MAASQLPFEILTIVATFTSTQDILSCTTVCKTWTAPFQNSLWHTINIHCKEKAKYFFHALSAHQDIYEKNGHRVRSLFLARNLGMIDAELCRMQAYFTNLRCLSIQYGNICTYSQRTVGNWGLWGSLKHLEIHFPGLTKKSRAKAMFKMLSVLPGLERLIITEDYGNPNHRLTWRDMETLHSFLPRLYYFHMDVPFGAIYPEDLDKIRCLSPEPNLITVHLFNNTLSLGWLYYAAIKYPEVTNFGWKVNRKEESTLEYYENIECPYYDDPYDYSPGSPLYSDISEEDDMVFETQEEALTAFATLAQFFPRLETLAIDERQMKEWVHSVFWVTLRHFDVSPKHLRFSLGEPINAFEKSQETIDKCILACSTTIETLELEISDSHLFHTPTYFDSFSHLVHVKLKMYSVNLELDILLDNWVSLKTLSLSMDVEKISITTKIPRYPPLHGLQTIEIELAVMHSNVFTYLSSRCRQLNTMVLRQVEIQDSVSSKTGCFYFNMPHTQLKTLRMHEVSFYYLGERDQNDDVDRFVNLVTIEQDKDIVQHDDSDKSTAASLSKDDPVPHSHPLWVHICGKFKGSKAETVVWTLGKKEVESVLRYFEAFQSNSKSRGIDRKVTRSYRGLVTKDLWETDIPHGYVKLYCKYVGEYYIDNFELSNATPYPS